MTNIEKKIKEVNDRLSIIINKLNIPDYLIPKINISNDLAYPYIDVGEDSSLFLVIRERGVEYERVQYPTIEMLFLKLFEYITFELAVIEEKKIRKNDEDYSVSKINQIQKELLKKIDLIN